MKKSLKPVLSSVLAGSLLFGSALPALAQDSMKEREDFLRVFDLVDKEDAEPVANAISREQAVELAMKTGLIPKDYELQYSSYQSPNRWSSHGTWNLDYRKRSGNRTVSYVNLGLHAETGEILSFRQYQYEGTPVFPAKLTREEAYTLAESTIKQYAADKFEQLVYDPFNLDRKLPLLDGNDRYTFRFYRQHEGIAYPQNYITVEINTAGEVAAYYTQWDQRITFTDIPEVVLSEDEARVKWEDVLNTQLELSYVIPWSSSDNKAYIQYEVSPYGSSHVAFIDAATGNALDYMLKETEITKPQLQKMSDKKLSPHRSGSTEMDEATALKFATDLLKINTNELKLDSTSYSSGENGRNQWSFYFRSANEGTNNYRYAGVTVDAKSGTVYSYHNEDSSRSGQSNEVVGLSEADMIKKVQGHIQKLVPEFADSIYYINGSYNPEDNYRFAHMSFRVLKNGIALPHNPININIDRETGEILYFYFNNLDREYPSAQNVLDQKAAAERFLSDSKVVLQYQTVQDYNEPQESSYEAVLVYQLQQPSVNYESVFLNAVEGTWHSRETGEVLNLNRQLPQDINNHWAKDALMLMYDYRAIDPDQDGNLLPDSNIKRGEMIKMLVIAMNRGHFRPMYSSDRTATYRDVGFGSAYFQYVEAAVDLNILDGDSANFNPEATLTREEIAVMVVKALGYDSLAKHGSMFNLTAKDAASITSKGHVAIANHLGLVTLQDNQFLPKREVTRAEAAVIFQRFLQKRNELRQNTQMPYYY